LQKRLQTVMEPRKSPVQARSVASVEAILKATLQVLVSIGKERLTTTRVATRAGVSVGTLYQYFPNKRALLRAALQRHMDEVSSVIERICLEQTGSSLEEMATALVTGFLEAKMKKASVSAALYSISSDIDGAKISLAMSIKAQRTIAAMLTTSRDPLSTDPQLVASMLHAAMASVSRRLMESATPEKDYPQLRHELIFLVRVYLQACSKGDASATLINSLQS
jgi:AcrR family transcriptional regulator